ncbi:MAG TPA: hypothetical protein PLL83_13645 [Rhodoferax sp.]|jgi:hypothetical protein|nr:hypothetical protein [Rhodoferax sp.]HPW85425.1 hypothetical protein [Rhodoferax sp.]HQC86125.1 hypothetical protein [Rhodoferax sp.]
MKILLSGEGPTDLGVCNNAQGRCDGADFKKGPMTQLLIQLLEPLLGYSLADFPESFAYVSETALCAQTKATPARLQPTRGKKKGVETSYFYGNAMTLGRMAFDLAAEVGDSVVAIFFRDTDGTHSSHTGLWQDKWQSVCDGFKHSDFTRGVPMLPKPKSEAWLLCLAGFNPGGTCEALEELSGNDHSPNSVKSRLDATLGRHHSADELCEWLIQHPVAVDRIDSMPSFRAFHEALISAVKNFPI